MTKFEPLAEEMESELVATMLESARHERASDDALVRTLSALGVGVGLTAAASSLKASSSALGEVSRQAGALGGKAAGANAGLGAKLTGLVGSSSAKWAATVGAVALIGFGVNDAWESGVAEEPMAVEVAAPAVAEEPPAAPEGGAAVEQLIVPEQEPAALEVREAPVVEKPQVKHTPKPRAPQRVAEPTPLLAREVKLIDRARAALGTGQPALAVKLARQYQRDFPRGRLLPEAVYLQMEGNLALGKGSSAEHDARRLEAFGKNTVHELRARQVLESE